MQIHTNDVTTRADSQCNNKEDNHHDKTAELDTELAEDQAAINQRLELTGDPLPLLFKWTTWKITFINVHQVKTTFQSVF